MDTVSNDEFGNMEDGDLYGLDLLIDSTDTIENLNKRLSEINEEEHNTFKFNNGIGAILVKVIPLPLIIAGIYYQIDPSFLALEISGKSASIFLSFILLGQMMWQLVLAQRAKGLRLTKANFELQGLIHKRNGRPFHSLEGYVEVNDFLEGEYLQSTLHRFMGFIAICNYLITLVGAVIWQMPYGYSELLATDIEAAPALLALSAGLGTGMTMALWGAVVMDKTVDFDSSKPTGLMHAYAPSGHPTSLQLAFTDILSSIMEPSIYTHFEIYKEYLQTKLKDEKNSIKAFEKILFLIYLNNQNVLKRVDIENEIGEDFEDVKECTLHLNSMENEWERVPVDLVVAQAIHESEWGRSRFAVEGNNLMGIRTFDSADDQMKPLNIPNSSWGLRIFETKCESISYYIDLLNNSHHYDEFREERLMQYISDIVDLEKLAMTLAIYAEDVYYTQKIIQTLRDLNDN